MVAVYLQPGGRCLHSDAVPTVRQLVSGLSDNAVYTVALVTISREVVDWPLHEERLARGVVGIHRKSSGNVYSAVRAASLSAGPTMTEEHVHGVLRAPIRRIVHSALLQYLAPQGHQASPTLPAMLLVVLGDQTMCPGGSEDGVPQSSSLPVEAHVVVQALPAARLPGEGGTARALLLGQPRELADVKHTQWVLTRKELEAERDKAGATEVLLGTAQGEVLEGLVTSFAVVMVQPGTGRPPVLQSATTNALLGVTMQRVFDAARRLGWEVDTQPPKVEQRHSWRVAFLCNCLRGVLPLTTISCPEGNPWSWPAWEVHLPLQEGGGQLLAELQQELAAVQQRWSVDDPLWMDNA